LTFSRTLLRTSLTILVMHFPGQHFYWYMCTCERRAGTKFTRIAAGDSSTSTCWFNWIISIHVDLVCIVFSGSRKMIRMFFYLTCITHVRFGVKCFCLFLLWACARQLVREVLSYRDPRSRVAANIAATGWGIMTVFGMTCGSPL